MKTYERLLAMAQEAANIPTVRERHDAKDRVDEEIQEAEYGFEGLSHELAERIRNVLYA